MSKYFKNLKFLHAPLHLVDTESVKEEYDEFLEEAEAAGRFIRTLREEKGWTQEQLGEMIGMDSERIERMENGQQVIPVVIAKRFGEIFEKDHRLFLLQ